MLTDDLLEGPLRRAPRQADRAGRKRDRPHPPRAALPAARLYVGQPTASARCATPGAAHGGDLVKAISPPSRRPAASRSSPRRRPTPSSRRWTAVLGQHPGPDSRGRRSLREEPRPPPARDVAGQECGFPRPRRRRAPARGGRALLLRLTTHGILFADNRPQYRRLRPALLPERRGRLRPGHGVVGAGLERAGGCPRQRQSTTGTSTATSASTCRSGNYIKPYIHVRKRHRMYYRHQVPRHHPTTSCTSKWVYDPDIARKARWGLHALALPGQPPKSR